MISVSSPMFLDVPDSMVLSPTSHDAPFNRKFNMAVVKPEIIITQAVYQLEGKFQRITLIFHQCQFHGIQSDDAHA